MYLGLTITFEQHNTTQLREATFYGLPSTSAERVVVHEGFKPESNFNNIALVKSKKWGTTGKNLPKDFLSKLMPICLPTILPGTSEDKGFALALQVYTDNNQPTS